MRPFTVLVVLVFTFAAGVVDATAQESRPGRPYRGLFASNGDGWRQTLTATGSVGAGYDTNLSADAAEAGVSAATPAVSAQGGNFGLLSGGLSYALNGARISIGASMQSSSRYYPGLSRRWSPSHAGSFATSLQLTAGTQVSLEQSAAYQRFGTFSLLPSLTDPVLGQAISPDQDFSGTAEPLLNYRTAAVIAHTQQLSRRASVVASYGYQRHKFTTGGDDSSSQNAAFRFTRELARGLGLRVGYGFTEMRYVRDMSDERTHTHNIDTGVDYNRELSISRRTRIGFSTGANAVKDSGVTRYQAIGSANLRHEIGRTWSASALYNRSAGFMQTFDAPAIYDALSIGLSGSLSRRVSLHSAIGSAWGTLGVGGNGPGSNPFDTYNASAGLRTALTRNAAISVNYVFYRYGFDSTSLLPTGLSQQLSRQSVHVSLSAWMPLLQRGRTTNASR